VPAMKLSELELIRLKAIVENRVDRDESYLRVVDEPNRKWLVESLDFDKRLLERLEKALEGCDRTVALPF
jgi:hypothetical protein